MALSAAFVTLGELADVPVDEAEDNELLQEIVNLVDRTYPEGWRNWKVVDLSREDIGSDSVTLNKLRYALPTFELIKTMDPETEYISEKSFKKLKSKLLDFAFTRALIIYPVSLGTRIRGSAAQYEIFNSAIESVKDRILSREAVNRLLKGEEVEVKRKRRSTSIESDRIKARRLDTTENTVAELSKRTTNIELLLQQILENQSSANSRQQNFSEDEVEGGDTPSDSDFEVDDVPLPAFLDDKENTPDIEFWPEVKEAEPAIPEAEEEVLKLGISCQRLGTPNWNRVRFLEAQKKLQATPVFTALKMNENLRPKDGKWCSSDTLTRFDSAMAFISHGLIKQRLAFKKGIDNVLKEVDAPNLRDSIKKNLTGESTDFKDISDTIMQFTCGKRADIINSRRELIKPSSKHLNVLLKEIPPSTTHLFDEETLSKVIKENGGIQKCFPSSRLAPLRQLEGIRVRPSRSYPQPSANASRRRKDQRPHPKGNSNPGNSRQKPKEKPGFKPKPKGRRF